MWEFDDFHILLHPIENTLFLGFIWFFAHLLVSLPPNINRYARYDTINDGLRQCCRGLQGQEDSCGDQVAELETTRLADTYCSARNHGVGSSDHFQEPAVMTLIHYCFHSHFIYLDK